jgi:TRAP-type mannitol/chloroaromatic compound transport system permease small subunit
MYRKISKLIDAISEICGYIGWLLVIYCMVFGVADVFLRYFFNAPTQWIGVTLQGAMVLIACFGGIYSLKHGAFVKLDLFYAKWSPKKKALADLATGAFTLLFLWVLIWKGKDAALMSLKLNQVTPSAVPIPIYPFKIIIPIAALFILILVVRRLIEDILILTGKRKSLEIQDGESLSSPHLDNQSEAKG